MPPDAGLRRDAPMATRWPAWFGLALDAAVFALLGLSLWLPSGYSIGAVLLLLLGLTRWPAVLRGRLRWSPPLAAWALTVAVMGAVWAMHIVADDGRLITHSLGLDRCIKYGLVLLVLPALLAERPRAAVLAWGCVLGAAGAGASALWDVLVLHHARAAGHTNAIQFGNLALLLGVWSGIWGLQAREPRTRWAGALGALLGLAASLASGSRGGWLALPLLLLLALWLSRPAHAAPTTRHRLRALALTALACLVLAALPPVQQRVQLAADEFARQQQQQAQDSSVGLRMAFWPFAWAEGKAHPLVGVGQQGYEAHQRAAVARGELPPEAVQFNHAHHEWLDMFAKRGLLGVLGLLLFYAVPGVLCWRALRRIDPAAPDAGPRRAAALCGLTTVVGFIAFGMTQVMFAHNNGNLMYLLCMSVWLAVCWHGPRAPHAAA